MDRSLPCYAGPRSIAKVYAASSSGYDGGMARCSTALLLLLSSSLSLSAQRSPASGLVGDWREPGDSVIRIAPCGPKLCARLVQISPGAPSRTDGHNANVAERARPLCGLEIGTGFQPTGPDRAIEGHLYDPKTGRTYHGEMMREGEVLHLRGYVGFRLFGRTEDWSWVSGGLKTPCSQAQ